MTDIESSLFAAIGEARVDGPNAKVVNLRLPATMADGLTLLAAQNGRTVAEEIRAAVRVSMTLARLSVVLDDELQTRRRDTSEGILGLTPETAGRFAGTLRDELADEWRQMLPGARRRFDRAFPNFLWSAKPESTGD